MPKTIKTIKPIKGYNQMGEYVEISNSDMYKGIYAIGMDDPIQEEQTVVKSKIGLGGLTNNEGGLLKRLKSYYIAYPDGFWIYAVLITLRKDPQFLRQAEKDIHRRLARKRYKSKYLTNLRVSEWFQASIEDIRQAFIKVNEKYPDDTFIIFPSEFEE